MNTALAQADDAQQVEEDQKLRLHIGGQTAMPGWKILNIQSGPNVDYIGSCTDLGQFADGTVAEVYASHVFEHLDYVAELPHTLKEIHRILTSTGSLYISVPDLDRLTNLFKQPGHSFSDRFMIMRMMFGGQCDAHDYHKVGLNWEFLCHFLAGAGFPYATRVSEFGMFPDTSALRCSGQLISLNVIAHKSQPPA